MSSIISSFNAAAPTSLSAHPWPQPGATILLGGLFSLWWTYTTSDAKLRAIFGAGLISTMDFVIKGKWVEKKKGNTVIVPFTKRFKEGITTRYQFFGNILAIPFFIDNFETYVPTRFLRIALFPFTFWAMELTMGYIFIYLNGYNPAWAFRHKDARFHVSPQVVEPRVLAKEPLQDADAKWIGLHRISYVDPHNKQRIWESAERKTRKPVGVDAVGIFPILKSATEPTRTLLVIQFRPALGKKCVEFPAGLIDDEETPEQAAVRELQEETGYHGLVSYASSVVYNDPGLTNANMKLVVVEVNMDDDRNRHPVPQLEDGEFIAAQIVPLEGLVERFDEMNQLGYAVDARLFHLAKGLAMARGLGL